MQGRFRYLGVLNDSHKESFSQLFEYLVKNSNFVQGNIFMRSLFILLSILFSTTFSVAKTERIPQLSNEQVNVWETVVYPGADEKLPLHRHEYNRILIPLDDGTLKVTNNKNETHLLELSKNKPYFLEKDPLNEQHTDINITDHPIRLIVIELKN